jgi:short subunit dehydrogenase-like uncharacterized protein
MPDSSTTVASSAPHRRVLIYGATGYTGTLISRLLAGRDLVAPGGLVLSGRDPGRLQALAASLEAPVELRPAAAEPAPLAAALAGIDVVLSCAGPFAGCGEAVVRAALAAGCDYLDISGEQSFLRDTYERCEALARRSRRAVVSGFAFEVVLGEWAAQLAARAVPGGELDELVIGYAIDHLHPTRGTMLSALSALAQPGCTWLRDRWVHGGVASRVRTMHFPPPFGLRSALLFPSGEVITVPRHQRSARVETYLALGEFLAGPAGQSALGGAGRLLLSGGARLLGSFLPALLASQWAARLRDHLAERPTAPTPEERRATRFSVMAEAARGFTRERVALSGRDIYQTSAELAVLGVRALLRRRPEQIGVLTPGQLVDADQLSEPLRRTLGIELCQSFAPCVPGSERL